MTWHLSGFAPFDLETTSVNTEEARIVTAYLGRCGKGVETRPHPGAPWLVAVNDVEIPPETTGIHRITTEHSRAHGMDQVNAVAEIAAAVECALSEGVPLVGHNIVYDLTVLDRECRRHLQAGLDRLIERPLAPVIDTKVLDMQVVPKRRAIRDERGNKVRGARTLRTVCEAHGLPWDEESAHGAEYDAMQAARVAFLIGAKFPVVSMPVMELHERQVKWAGEQAESFRAWLRSQDKFADDVSGDWPLTPFEARLA